VGHRFLIFATIFVVLSFAPIVPGTDPVSRRDGALPAPILVPVARTKDRPFQFLGAGSCASASCHNSPDTTRLKGREYAVCLTDKHDRAYGVLLEERSKKIEQRYHGLGDWQSAQPERDLLCLKCHVHPEMERVSSRIVNGVRPFRLEDGVSCEACHGPAERWLDAHHRPEWQGLSALEKQTHYGMWDTRSVSGRVQGCVACHVGAPGMEVNHDLIAAGHPRLAFEFSSYHSLMTRHWDDARDRDPARGGDADFEVHAWMTGQIVVLKAALELLHHRAERKAWPEFAEFDCYACHHDLQNAGAKQDRTFPGRIAGRLPWSRWATAQVEAAFALRDGKIDADIKKSLASIRQEMQKLVPDKESLSREIPIVVRQLENALQRRGASRVIPVREGMAQIAKDSGQSWDEAAQTYNGLVAWERTRIDRRETEIPSVRANLERLRATLLPDARFRLDEVRRVIGRISGEIEP
jgi:hypothetical protein